MTPESQRIAIAEACGFQWIFTYKSTSIGDELTNQRVLTKKETYHRSLYEAGLGDGFVGQDVPRYLTDLNAMHEAEKVLDQRQGRDYRGILLDVCEGIPNALHATAAQRAEAFLRAIGKWTSA